MDNSIEVLKQLVGIGSYSGHEEKISQFIYEWLTSHGIHSEWQNKNVVAYIKGRDNQKAIIFNGHMDTVSAGTLADWRYPALSLTQEKDKLFGLGSSDMKGGLTAMMGVANIFGHKTPACDLWFSFVVKEEIDGSGSKQFVRWFQKTQQKKYSQVSGIVCEPTNLETLQIGQKGNAFIKIITHGDSGHGSKPEAIKHNAILEMVYLINKLQKIKNSWQSNYADKYLGFPSVGVTGLTAGSTKSPNKFPGECSAIFDIRTTMKFHDNIEMELKKWLSGSSATFHYIAKPGPCGYCQPSEEIVVAFQKAVKGLPLTCSTGASDQCFFGKIGIPTVIFGPGNLSCAHQTNEWLESGQIETAVQIYQEVVDFYSFAKIKHDENKN